MVNQQNPMMMNQQNPMMMAQEDPLLDPNPLFFESEIAVHKFLEWKPEIARIQDFILFVNER